MTGSKPSTCKILSTKKNPVRNGSIPRASQKHDCCSQTPAIFFLPLPTA